MPTAPRSPPVPATAAASASASRFPLFPQERPHYAGRVAREEGLDDRTAVPGNLPLLTVLRHAYPDGVPERDYLPLLDALQYMSVYNDIGAIQEDDWPPLRL
jgi:hypothetical protein